MGQPIPAAPRPWVLCPRAISQHRDQKRNTSRARGRVLRNLLGITSVRQMDRTEYEALIRVQEGSYRRFTADTRFTAKNLREMHREWLGELYAWAGQYRTVELSKAGFTWPPAHRVGDNMAALEADLLRRHTPCRPAAPAEVGRRLAEVHAELLLIHPFRDGNGRLARWLAGLMALQAGYAHPVYGFTGRGATRRRARYLNAVERGYLQDYVPLAGFFEETLTRGLEARGRSLGTGSP
jgi:cell filamentation protein